MKKIIGEEDHPCLPKLDISPNKEIKAKNLKSKGSEPFEIQQCSTDRFSKFRKSENPLSSKTSVR